jgi:hypothetical protein
MDTAYACLIDARKVAFAYAVANQAVMMDRL